MKPATDTLKYTRSEDLIQDFVTRGITVLSPHSLGVPLSVHETIFEKEKELFSQRKRITSQVIPEILEVLNSTGVVHALQQLAGEHYAIVPFTHNTPFMSGPYDQHWHKDDTGPLNLRKQRHHQAVQIEMLYYPQEVKMDMGPTATVPYSQYWTFDHEENLDNFAGADHLDFAYQTGGMERIAVNGPKSIYARSDVVNQKTDHDIRMRKVVLDLKWPHCQPFEAGPLEAGSVILYSHNLLHRGNHRRDDWQQWKANPRFMWRFWVYRTHEPMKASFSTPLKDLDDQDDTLTNQALGKIGEETSAVWRTQHHWLTTGEHAQKCVQTPTVDDLVERIHLDTDQSEPKRIGAAYQLAEHVDRVAAISALVGGLSSTKESVRRASLYGLIALGPEATPSVLPLASSEHKWVRRGATFVLGCAGDITEEVLGVLRERLLEDTSTYVRSVAADAIGCFGRRAAANPRTRPLIASCADSLIKSLEREPNRLGMDIAQSKSIKFVRPTEESDVCEGIGMAYEQDRFEPVRSAVRENALWAMVILCSHGEEALGSALSSVIAQCKEIVQLDKNIFAVGLALDALQRLISLTPKTQQSSQLKQIEKEMDSIFAHIPIHPIDSLVVSGMGDQAVKKHVAIQ